MIKKDHCYRLIKNPEWNEFDHFTLNKIYKAVSDRSFIDNDNDEHSVTTEYLTEEYWRDVTETTPADDQDIDIQIRISIRKLYRDSSLSPKEFNKILGQEQQIITTLKK